MSSPNIEAKGTAQPAIRQAAAWSKGRRVFALVLLVVGTVSLAANLGLITPGAQHLLAAIWPAGVIAVGIGLLILGDYIWGPETTPYSVARGQTEGAELLVSAGVADVQIGPTSVPAELVSGVLPLPKRPAVQINEQHTTIRLEPLWGMPSLSRAHWSAALATDLPWQMSVRSSTGNLTLDLQELLPVGVHIRSLFGDVELKLPTAGGADLDIRLTFGDLTIVVPGDLGVKVVLQTGALADVERDERRFIRPGANEIGTPLYAVAARRCTLAVWLGTGHLRLM